MKKYHLIFGQVFQPVTDETHEIEIVLIYDVHTIIVDLFLVWVEAISVYGFFEIYKGCGFRMRASGFVSEEYLEYHPDLMKYELKPSLNAFSLNYN